MAIQVENSDAATMEEVVYALEIFERRVNDIHAQVAEWYTTQYGTGSQRSSAYNNQMRDLQKQVEDVSIKVMREMKFANQNVKDYARNRLHKIAQIYSH